MTDTPAHLREIGEPVPVVDSIEPTTHDSQSLHALRKSLRDQTRELIFFLYSQPPLDTQGRSFEEDHYKAMLADTELDAIAMRKTLEGNNYWADQISALRVSAAHEIWSARADDMGDGEAAWLMLSEARFWLGLAYGGRAITALAEDVLHGRSKAGASKRNAKFEPLRKHARELAASKNYPSKRNAALSIKEAVLSKAAVLGIELSENQAERTITGWLDGMTFARK
ncbi:hypothetical protein [Burkholderia multivorans]|uniref:hypothetical protein n=1 Tax=Burkholderia multivorans TaxID=87883 RepID=UPI0005C6D372|nr:hypothetical protein [Burkholderia multivorans]MBJ9616929.1 hypothetical protein [Burkholderia multivorans]PRF57657.1 hypothetical protein C6Q28_19185 [Burkholderia multivorans]PRG51761.1 hypothetical protein C6T63_16135 [Burkholderia multivorans]RSB73660.1 hypothetical protein EGT33_21335 [Burkholderia multivorans]